jgi:Ca2+-binding RTX toxin-like protein
VLGVTAHSRNVENLVYGGFGASFAGQGNALANIVGSKYSFSSTVCSLKGQGGADTLNGGTAADVLDGGSGADRMTGYGGNDSYFVDDLGDVVIEASGSFAGKADRISASISLIGANRLADNVEKGRLLGAAGLNMDGNAVGNRLAGNDAANALNGLGGNDLLLGNAGADLLDGGNGKDRLYGGAGQDRLTGGAARDVLSGDADADRFDFNATSDSGVTEASRDAIRDFAHGVDKIDLATIDAKASLAGNNAFTYIGAAGFSAEGQIRAVQDGTATIVEINVAGTSGAEMAIRLDNVTADVLNPGDFVL